MDIATQSNFVFVGSGIFENDDILLRLELELDNLPICLEKSDIFDKMVFLYLVRIIRGSYLDDDTIPLLFIERNMARFLLADPSYTRELLDIHRGFYEAILGFSAMRAYPGFVEIFESGSW